jgi:hypothetical protein
MNLQPQPRTNLMLTRPYPDCVLSGSYRPYLRLTAPSGNVSKLMHRHQDVTHEHSPHQNLSPTGHHKQLKPIQLP